MSRITLPQGQSIREIAERLGVPVEDLMRHAGVSDAEAPLPVAKAVEVPDGFLRSRIKKERLQDAVTHKSGKQGGMNMWLAMDIEQKRTRVAGGINAHAAKDHELDGLAEARRTYLRFEGESNELAVALYGQLTSTQSIGVRAQAFAGQALAFAQRTLLFGEPVERSRQHALSSAKAALLADPKLADAHLGMALGLRIGAQGDDLQEAETELESAVRSDAQAIYCWAELADLRLLRGDMLAANDAIRAALKLDPGCPRALHIASELALHAGQLDAAQKLLDTCIKEGPHYLAPRVVLARVLRKKGQSAEAGTLVSEVLALASTDRERALLEHSYMADRSMSS